VITNYRRTPERTRNYRVVLLIYNTHPRQQTGKAITSSVAVAIELKPAPYVSHLTGDETTWDVEDVDRRRDSIKGPPSLEVEKGMHPSHPE
jgi:hypothetical protein